VGWRRADHGFLILAGLGACLTADLGGRAWDAFRPGLVGSTVLLAAAAQAVLVEFSIYPPNSYQFAFRIAFGAIAYFCFRVLSEEPFGRTALLYAGGAGAAMLAFATMRTSVELCTQAKDLGFSSYATLKSVLPGVGGGPLGETAALLLLTAVFPISLALTGPSRLALGWWTLTGLSFSALALTFSRGGATGLAVFLCAAAALLWRFDRQLRRQLLRGGAVIASAGLFLISTVPLPGPDHHQESSRKQVVQSRSIQGRLLIWEHACRALRAHPLAGVGGGNFAATMGQDLAASGERPFIGRAFNIAIELAVEQGGIGIALLLALGIAVLKTAAGSLRPTPAGGILLRICMAALAGLLVMDMTYSSVLHNACVLSLAAYCAATISALSCRAAFEPGSR
jgi:hypothetical protein